MWAAFQTACRGFSFDVQLMLLAICCPLFFHRSGLILRRDFESGQRQDQGTHTNMGFRRRSGYPTLAAGDDWCLDIPACPNPLKRSVHFVPQTDERRHRHSRVPLCPQPHDHLREPSSLRVAGRHFPNFSSSTVFGSDRHCNCAGRTITIWSSSTCRTLPGLIHRQTSTLTRRR